MRTGHIPRFHLAAPLAAGASIELPREAAHHATRVLRLRIGESVDGVMVVVGAHQAHDRESPLAVTLVQGIAGADRMDFIIQKAVELGAAAIQPVLTS